MASQSKKKGKMHLAVSQWIRKQQDKPQNIPISIETLIGNFASLIFGKTQILSVQEDLDLAKLISKQLSNCVIQQYKLIFRASQYDFSAEQFHQQCDREGTDYKTVVVIHSRSGNKFGGYTTKSWLRKDTNGYWQEDKSAFVFLIFDNCGQEIQQADLPLVFPIKSDSKKFAICCVPAYGPTYGHGFDIFCDNKLKQCEIIQGQTFSGLNSSLLTSYYNPKYPSISLCGGNITQQMNIPSENQEYLFELIEYEVYEVIIQ